MKHFLLFYEVEPDYKERRGEFCGAHLEKAWAAHQRGELILGGALANPVDGAVLLFKGETEEVAARGEPEVARKTAVRASRGVGLVLDGSPVRGVSLLPQTGGTSAAGWSLPEFRILERR